MTTTQRFLGAMTALMIAASTNAQSAPSPTAAVTIVLVHGALIDGSSWRGVYDVLTKDGYRVSIVQPPLTGPDRQALRQLAQQEERRPEERVRVDFVDEAADGRDGQGRAGAGSPPRAPSAPTPEPRWDEQSDR